MTQTLILIDGTNYAFRAFYALPPMVTAKGFQTNALYGYTLMLLNLIEEQKPDYLAVAFDTPAPTFRKKKFEAYKAQRKSPPPELIQQLPLFRRVTEALNVPFFELEGYEADDLIATLAERNASASLQVRIVSTDKDLMQLVSDNVVTVDTLRNRVFDAAAVEDKWGVPPVLVRDVLALQGDSSDNIPGVPGIGPKKARDLVKEFGSVPELLGRIDEVRNLRIRGILRENVDAARLSFELITLEKDVPLEMPLESLRVVGPNLKLCQTLFEELEFRKFLIRVGAKGLKKMGIELRPVVAVTDLEVLLAEIEGAPEVALVILDDGEGKCSELVLSTREDLGWQIRLTGAEAANTEILSAIRTVIEAPGVAKVGYGLKRGAVLLARQGWRLEGIVSDMRLAAYLLNPSRSGGDVWDLAQSFLRREAPEGDAADKMRKSVGPILRLQKTLEKALEEAGMGALFREVEVPLIRILADIESVGIRVETKQLEQLSVVIGARLAEIEACIYEVAGEVFNPNSPKQLQKILFEKLGLRVVKKTKTGPSTDQSVLEVLAQTHPLPAHILEYRSLAKLKNTYIDTLPSQVDDNSRVHSTFNQTVAATGRLSSSDPNLQNIPIRSEEGRMIRKAFVPDVGHLLLSADYSQIELRVLAHLSEDDTLIESFIRGDDIHAATAAEIFDVPLSLVSGQQRRSAKAINFGVLYGMGAFRLARELQISRKEADSYIQRYFERYSKVRVFLDAILEAARSDGYVTTLMGRRRYVPELSAARRVAQQAGERIAINTPIQGSAADIIKLAMILVRRSLLANGLKARMLLQVHDELVFEVPEAEVKRTREVVKTSMEGVVSLRCPLIVDLGEGSDWATAH